MRRVGGREVELWLRALTGGTRAAGVLRPDATSDSLNMLFRQMFPMFMCPPALADEFRTAGVHEVSEVTPDRVRQRIRKDVNIMQACYAIFTRSSETQGEARAKFSSFVIDTLEFCLSDLSAHAPAGTPKAFREMQGLRLLPVAGGQLLPFPSDAVVALPDEHKLLPALGDNMVQAECVQRLSRYFLNPDFLAAMGLRRFSPAVLAAHMHMVLPRHWKGASTVGGYARDAAGLPPPSWFRSFWAFVGADNMHLFNQWPVIPLSTGELAAAASLQTVLILPSPLPPLPACDGASEPVGLFDFAPADAASAPGQDAQATLLDTAASESEQGIAGMHSQKYCFVMQYVY